MACIACRAGQRQERAVAVHQSQPGTISSWQTGFLGNLLHTPSSQMARDVDSGEGYAQLQLVPGP